MLTITTGILKCIETSVGLYREKNTKKRLCETQQLIILTR